MFAIIFSIVGFICSCDKVIPPQWIKPIYNILSIYSLFPEKFLLKRHAIFKMCKKFNFNQYRGHFLFYGKDFITYKLERPYDKDRNEFLRILSNFMSNVLEDHCPSSIGDGLPLRYVLKDPAARLSRLHIFR